MKLLAIGGPRHGQEMPYSEGQQRLLVPIIPDLKLVAGFGHERYCVHGGTVPSKNDGDRNFVSAASIASLYGLWSHEWRSADRVYGSQHATDEYCLFPDYWGRYDRRTLPKLDRMEDLTIKAATYERRVVSDRVVWVFVG